MVTIDSLHVLALSFPDTAENNHFDKVSFRVNSKIFATYNAVLNQVCIKLSEIDQDVFTSTDRATIYPVPNKWGKQGWTVICMDSVHPDLFTDALTTAYHQVAFSKNKKRS